MHFQDDFLTSSLLATISLSFFPIKTGKGQKLFGPFHHGKVVSFIGRGYVFVFLYIVSIDIDGFSAYYNSSRLMRLTRGLLVGMWSIDNIYKDGSLLHFPFSYLPFSFSVFLPMFDIYNPVDVPYSKAYLYFFLIHCHEWHCVIQLQHHHHLSLGLSEELETVIFIYNI